MNRALQKASSAEIRLAKLKRKHEAVARSVSFSVLAQEPMTKQELALVKAGIEIDTWPAILRWAKRSKRNDLNKVLYVEPTRTGPHTAADISEYATCVGKCSRKFRSKSRKRQ